MTIGPAHAHAADTTAELRRSSADVVVSSDRLFGPMIAARAAGAKLAILTASISVMTPIPAMPPVGPGPPPPVAAQEHAAAAGAAAWFSDRMQERLPVLNAARAVLGLPTLTDSFDQTREADMILLATSRAFDFPVPALPGGMHYVGPLLDPPNWAGVWTSPWPEDDPRPLIPVAMSTTFQDQVGTIQAVIDAAARLPVRVLVTLGPGLAGTALQLSENAVAVPSAPHDEVMPRALVVVTHCGHGTAMRTLSHRRPMLCLPMGRDQNDNAARIVARGASIRLPPDSDALSLRQALSTLLDDPSYAQAAGALGQAIAISEPGDVLVAAMEGLAAQGRQSAAA